MTTAEPPRITERAQRYADLVDEVSALLEDKDLMWRMGAIEWEIEGPISPGLRAEVIRQAREHVSNLAAALSLPPVECSHANWRDFRDIDGGHRKCLDCGRVIPPEGRQS